MAMDFIEAEYLIETPLEPEAVAEIIAGEQSNGTFVPVAGETAELKARVAARILSVTELESKPAPSLSSAWLESQHMGGPYRRARLRVAFPADNIGPNLPTLAATVCGNLYDLGQLTGLRLLDLVMPASYRQRFAYPRAGTQGTRDYLQVWDRPLFGTIIKPNVGLHSDEIAALVGDLCEAGIDFVKDDEIAVNPTSAPLAQRVPAVMQRVRAYRERTGRNVMVAFNITDEVDAMRRHAELVEREGGACVMVSMNWVGLAALQTLRKSTDLIVHGHRNGYGAFHRHPALGMSVPAYQALYRLAGVDHMHVHGIGGKFADADEEVAAAARLCGRNLAVSDTTDDRVLPVFSSGQWAGSLPATRAAIDSPDFLLLAGGGILAHPGGPDAGVRSLHQAWETIVAGESLADGAARHQELAQAVAHYGAMA